MSNALTSVLRPYRKNRDKRHVVIHIRRLLNEFYKRYDRLLNRPWTVHVANEYTLLHDISKAVLNAIQELHYARPPMMNRGLDIVIRLIMSRTTRMLRVLRHKYPAELRGMASSVAGSAPRAHDPSTTESTVHSRYAMFV